MASILMCVKRKLAHGSWKNGKRPLLNAGSRVSDKTSVLGNILHLGTNGNVMMMMMMMMMIWHYSQAISTHIKANIF